MENKQQLRQVVRQKINNQTIDDKNYCSQIIFEQLINSKIINQSKTISIYWATKSEVATEAIIKHLLAQNKKVCLPQIDENNQMAMYAIDTSKINKKTHQFSFQIICHPAEIDCIIVPGVAFDLQNNRLGQGQGHYDRYLKQIHRPIIMLAFEIQKVNSIVVDEWDVPMTTIYTEKFIYNKCNNKI